MQTTLFNRTQFLLLIGAFLLAGCAKGIDRPLVTGKDDKAFQESIAAAAKDMSEREKLAALWAMKAIPNINNLDEYHARYPNGTTRQFIRGQVKGVLDEYPKIVAELEPRMAASEALLLELNKIVANDIGFSLARDFFGLQPTITAKVMNGSRLAASTLQWNASLFIEGRAEPVATAQLYDFYNESFRATTVSQGLVPGKSETRRFRIGHVSGDRAWTTIEIQNAKQRRVELVVMPGTVKDLADKGYLDLQQHSKLKSDAENRKAAIETAKCCRRPKIDPLIEVMPIQY